MSPNSSARSGIKAPPSCEPRPTQPNAFTAPTSRVVPGIVAIGTSTGGPKALQEILPLLPEDLPVGILVVQHIPAGFTGPLAKRLNELCRVRVHEVESGMTVERGHVYLAPAGKHMIVRRAASGMFLQISAARTTGIHVPSVDIMMLSVAAAFHSHAMGIIMTGMGADGALGMQAIFREGGLTVGQNESTCAVYGMPRVCAQMGILKRVVALPEIPRQILSALRCRTH